MMSLASAVQYDDGINLQALPSASFTAFNTTAHSLQHTAPSPTFSIPSTTLLNSTLHALLPTQAIACR